MRRIVRQTICLIILAVGPTACGDDPAPQAPATAPVVGRISDLQGAPVAGATVLLAAEETSGVIADDARGVTDAAGNYGVDLPRLPWATGRLRAIVVAPGYRLAAATIEPAPRAGRSDQTLTPEAWRTTEVRWLDPAGRPLAGLDLACKIRDRVTWGCPRTDADGRCRVEMPRDLEMTIRAAPAGLRPIRVAIGNRAADPVAVVARALPTIRGRVVDPTGRPVVGALVGRSIERSEDRPIVHPHHGAKPPRTDADGRFELAPLQVVSSLDRERPDPAVAVDPICVADRDPRRMAFRLVDFARQVDPVEITLTPGRPVTVPLAFDFAAAGSEPEPVIRFSLIARSDPAQPWREPVFFSRKLPAGDRRVEIALPPGTFILRVTAQGSSRGLKVIRNAERELVVPEGEGPIAVPTLRLEPPRR